MNVRCADKEIQDILEHYRAIGELLSGVDGALLTDDQIEVLGHVRYGFPISESNKLKNELEDTWKEFRYVDRKEMFHFDFRMFAKHGYNCYVYDGEKFKLVTTELKRMGEAMEGTCP